VKTFGLFHVSYPEPPEYEVRLLNTRPLLSAFSHSEETYVVTLRFKVFMATSMKMLDF
jgi:hypothetical protein